MDPTKPDMPSPTTRSQPAVALGTMNFGKRTDAEAAREIFFRAIETHGISTIDTANLYQDGGSERIVGALLREVSPADRSRLTVATKVGLLRRSGRSEGLGKGTVLQACDESLTRLGVAAIDLYYLHSPDARTPLEQTLEAVAELLASKKILAWGISNFASWQILEALTLAEKMHLPRPAISQVIYNLLVRQIEIEYLRFAQRYALFTTVYNPLAGGLLSGKYQSVAEPSEGRFAGNSYYLKRYLSPRMLEQVESYRAIAHGEGCSLIDLAYGWLMGRAGVGSILVGPGSVAHLDDAMRGVSRKLSLDALRRIDMVYAEYLGTDAKYAR